VGRFEPRREVAFDRVRAGQVRHERLRRRPVRRVRAARSRAAASSAAVTNDPTTRTAPHRSAATRANAASSGASTGMPMSAAAAAIEKHIGWTQRRIRQMRGADDERAAGPLAGPGPEGKTGLSPSGSRRAPSRIGGRIPPANT
jgi:hypothetical protein